MVSILHSLQRELTYLLTCGKCSLSFENQNDTAVSWITLWRMIKVYWLDLTLAYILESCCLLHFCCKFGLKLASHYQQLRTKHSSSNCLNHVQRSKSPIKKWIVVHWTVWSMFNKQAVRPVKNGLKAVSEVCSANKQFVQLRTGLRLCLKYVRQTSSLSS